MVAEVSGAMPAPPAIMDDVATAERILIGRDAELEELSSLLGVAQVRDVTPVDSTSPHHVLLPGDPGVGKTGLLEGGGSLASARGWQTYAGHCLDFGDSA